MRIDGSLQNEIGNAGAESFKFSKSACAVTSADSPQSQIQ